MAKAMCLQPGYCEGALALIYLTWQVFSTVEPNSQYPCFSVPTPPRSTNALYFTVHFACSS